MGITTPSSKGCGDCIACKIIPACHPAGAPKSWFSPHCPPSPYPGDLARGTARRERKAPSASPGQPAGLSSPPPPPLSSIVPGFESQLSCPLPSIMTLGKSLSPPFPPLAEEHTTLTRFDESLLCNRAWPMGCLFSGSERVKGTELGGLGCFGQGPRCLVSRGALSTSLPLS